MMKSLSVVICAYNEEKTICKKIENILSVDKNGQVVEIIVVDDNSSDKTHEIASGYAASESKAAVLRNERQKGKWGALVTGFRRAKGEIVCVTDADVLFEKGIFENTVRLFNDPSVGGVTCSQKNAVAKNGKEYRPSVSLYEKIRNFLRKMESRIDSTILFHGQCMFIRKACLDLPQEGPMGDDVYIAILIRKNGYRVVFCASAYYIEKMPVLINRNFRKIFYRRAKAITQVIMANRDILFDPKYKGFGFICFPIQFFLHIIFPFVIAAATVLIIYFLISAKHPFLLGAFSALFVLGYKPFIMTWLQMASVVEYLLRFSKNESQWVTRR